MLSISTRLVIFECEILVKTCRTSSPKQTFLLREQKPKSQKSHYSKFTKGARSSVLPHNNQHSSVLMAVSSCDSGGGKAAERWMQKKRTASGFQAQLTQRKDLERGSSDGIREKRGFQMSSKRSWARREKRGVQRERSWRFLPWAFGEDGAAERGQRDPRLPNLLQPTHFGGHLCKCNITLFQF